MTFSAAPLSEICLGGGSYGIAASAVEYSSELPTYLRITDINDDGTLNMNGLKSVDDFNSAKYYLSPNDIVFARTGASTGRNYFYDGSDGEFVYAGFLIKFSLDPLKVNPLFVKYYCQSKDYYDWVASFNTGSTRGNINAQTLGNMPIPVLKRAQQDLIADTLSTLDAQIDGNKKLNHHLVARSVTDSSPDIRRGKRVSRKSARRLDSALFACICRNIGFTASSKLARISSLGNTISKALRTAVVMLGTAEPTFIPAKSRARTVKYTNLATLGRVICV